MSIPDFRSILLSTIGLAFLSPHIGPKSGKPFPRHRMAVQWLLWEVHCSPAIPGSFKAIGDAVVALCSNPATPQVPHVTHPSSSFGATNQSLPLTLIDDGGGPLGIRPFISSSACRIALQMASRTPTLSAFRLSQMSPDSYSPISLAPLPIGPGIFLLLILPERPNATVVARTQCDHVVATADPSICRRCCLAQMVLDVDSCR